jgi:DNA-binding NarL/FixJ family response regulator
MRTVVADGEPTVRGALRTLMTQGLSMQVVGESDTAAALLSQVQLHRPELVIVAWDLIAAHSEASLAALRRSSGCLRIVVVGLRPETRAAALRAGADDYISMVDAPDVVVRVLQAGWEHEEPAGTVDETDVPRQPAHGGLGDAPGDGSA